MSNHIEDECRDDELHRGDKAQMLRAEGPQPGQRWRHYKGGEYRVVLRSVRESDLTQLVSYESIDHGEVWTRTLFGFLYQETSEGPMPRFTPVSFNPEIDDTQEDNAR